jgi:phosphate-selective porin OprO/OprP
VSGLPVYEDDGRYLLHLGLAYQWRKGSPPADFNGGTVLPNTPDPAVTTNTDLFRFRARPGERDAVGLQGDGVRVVDTGNIIATRAQAVNAEFMAYCGPFWVQAEATATGVSDAVFPAAAGGTPRGMLTYWGAYAMVGYFLTGENRGYDKPMGKYGRVVPRRNFALARDKDGCLKCGPGAWEVLYRYSYLDLNSDSVQGGTYGEHTVGVNWYWSPNIKVQMNYLVGQRIVPAVAASGIVQGFGIRGALEF